MQSAGRSPIFVLTLALLLIMLDKSSYAKEDTTCSYTKNGIEHNCEDYLSPTYIAECQVCQAMYLNDLLYPEYSSCTQCVEAVCSDTNKYASDIAFQVCGDN